MYQITCPECGHVDTSPFVRLEAVTACSAHRHRFRVAASHLALLPTESGPEGFVDDGLLTGLADIAQARRSERQRLDQQGNVIGLSGLSNLMKKEKERTARAPQAAPAAPAAPVAGSGAGEPAASVVPMPVVEPIPTAPARGRGLYVLFAGGICLAAGLLGAGLMLLSRDLSPGPGALVNPAGQDTGMTDGGSGPISTGLVVGAGTLALPRVADLDPAMEIADTDAQAVTWEPASIVAPVSSMETLPVTITEWALTHDAAGEPWLTGRLVSQHPRWIGSARLTLALTDAAGVARVVGDLPVRGLPPQESLALRLPYPAEAVPGLRPVVTGIERVQELRGVEKITDLQVVPMGTGPGAMLQLTASSPAISPRRGMMFVVTAEDATGQMLVRRVFDRQRMLSGAGRAAFYVRVPLPGSADLAQWRVYGIVYD